MDDDLRPPEHFPQPIKVTALAGGVGASKFLVGLAAVMPPENITVVANTGDAIKLYGLHISPDIDTVMYTLAGVINQATGWGIAGDSFESLAWLARYAGRQWFNLGDRDLATHIYRTAEMSQGRPLSEVTDRIRRSLGVACRILPMTDLYTPTRVMTDEGEMHFQEYFVRRRAEPRVRGLRFENVESARPAPGVLSALVETDVVVVCPSNPFISVGPILAVPGVRDAVEETRARVIAITPIIGGRALKGPAADMLRDLGFEVSARSVAEMYSDFADAFVLDEADRAIRPSVEALGIEVLVANTVMTSPADKQRLAREVLTIAALLTAER